MDFEATLASAMLRQQAHRLTTTIFVVFAMLFSQLALANFVCASQPAEAAPAAVSAMEMAPGMPCAEMGSASDEGQSVLCHQHCSNAPQSLDPGKLPGVSLPAVLHMFVVSLVLDSGADESAIHALVAQFRPPSDPVFFSTLRLRV